MSEAHNTQANTENVNILIGGPPQISRCLNFLSVDVWKSIFQKLLTYLLVVDELGKSRRFLWKTKSNTNFQFFQYYSFFLLKLSKARSISSGTAKMTVLDWSELKSFIDCSVLRCKAPLD